MTAIVSYQHLSLDDLKRDFEGQKIQRLSTPEVCGRLGIITDVLRDKWNTYAVILWDTDHPTEEMGWDNDYFDDSIEDLTVQGAVETLSLTTITSIYRWHIG